MNINFKQPKYVLPVLALPFLVLFFYVYHSSSSATPAAKPQAGINGNVGEVSDVVRKKDLSSKLDAYRNTYKEADGFTAVSPVPVDKATTAALPDNYSGKEKKMLDSINLALKEKYNTKSPNPAKSSGTDQTLAAAINHLKQRKEVKEPPPPKEKDPMEMFRQQMAYMDSLNKSNDPEFKAAKKKRDALARADSLKAKEVVLKVHKAFDNSLDFNTIKPQQDAGFITAVIDENITGYAGSRLRLRLLEDITVGDVKVKKGTFLYALINGFSAQRVTLAITSILYDSKILPVKLSLYDMDGLPGLYVPSSAFREFTKDAGTNTVQGVTVESSNTSFLMSTADKLFQSTSTAIANIIRKDKAKLKYNTYIYLIDNEK